jgi:hypothetical protein
MKRDSGETRYLPSRPDPEHFYRSPVRTVLVILRRWPGTLEIFADPMLEKVFLNLFDNAVSIPVSMKEQIFSHGFGRYTGFGLFLIQEILDITGTSIREIGVEGEGQMHINNEVNQVVPGHAVYIPPHSIEYIKNIGETDLKFLCIVDPAWKTGNETIMHAARYKFKYMGNLYRNMRNVG